MIPDVHAADWVIAFHTPSELLGVHRVTAVDPMTAAPISTIHVSDAGRFGFARLSAAELGLEGDAFFTGRCGRVAELLGRQNPIVRLLQPL